MKLASVGLLVALVASGAGAAGDAATKRKPKAARTADAVPTCGSAGVDVTIALAYHRRVIGPVAGTYVEVGFGPPLTLPADPKELRSRLTSLMPPPHSTGSPELRSGQVRVALTTTEQSIDPGKVLRIRFDCPEGTRVAPESLSCTTTEVVSGSGQMLEAELAHGVRCTVAGLDSEH
jgi:hypothetical protein